MGHNIALGIVKEYIQAQKNAKHLKNQRSPPRAVFHDSLVAARHTFSNSSKVFKVLCGSLFRGADQKLASAGTVKARPTQPKRRNSINLNFLNRNAAATGRTGWELVLGYVKGRAPPQPAASGLLTVMQG